METRSIEEILSNGVSCLAHKCFNTRILKPELVYYKMPKEVWSCNLWLKNAGRLDLLQMPLDVVKRNYYLCEQHFESKWFRKPEWKASLTYYKNPIPTIFKNNMNDFPLELVQEAYEAKMKREEFMSNFPDFDESITLDGGIEILSDSVEEYSNDIEVDGELIKAEFEDSIKEEELTESEYINSNYEYLEKSKPCRFCTFPVGEDGIHIFGEEDESTKIQEMVNVVLPAQIHENDGLPHNMCLICIDKLKQCYETILAYYAAEAFFRSQEEEEYKEDITLDVDLPADNGDCFQDTKPAVELSIMEPPVVESLVAEPSVIESSVVEPTETSLLEDNLVDEDHGEIEDIAVNLQTDNTELEIIIKCEFCYATCSTVKNLVLHKKRRHPPGLLTKKRFYCLKCPMIFMKAKTLKSHMKSAHPPPETDYPCEDCDRVFKMKYLLNSHRKLMHKKNICQECGESFYYPVLLQRHMRLHDDSTKCSVCDKEFKTAYWRRVHEKTHSTEGCHLCWVCGKVFHLRTTLHTHLQAHTTKFRCGICGKLVSTSSGYKKHLLTHQERVKNYQCSICKKTFFSKQLLTQHSYSHTGVRPYVCHCGAAFNRLSNLNYHKKRHSEPFQKKPKSIDKVKNGEVYKCETCNKEISSKLTFKYHVARHTGNKKPFDCEECGLSFSTTYSYKTHVRIHTGERPFVCQVENCGLGFRSKSTLQQHEIVHLDERPFVCPYCPVSFKRLYSLNMHKTTHSALRPFQCTICERAFARKPDARIHVMRQHGISSTDVYDYLQDVMREEETEQLNFPYVVEEELFDSGVADDISESNPIKEENVELIEQPSVVYEQPSVVYEQPSVVYIMS